MKRTEFWGDTSLKTLLTGHILIPDGKGKWTDKYFRYWERIIWPEMIVHTLEHIFSRTHHFKCHSLIKKCAKYE